VQTAPALAAESEEPEYGLHPMCGRFTLRTPTRAVVKAFGLADAPNLKPRYNIAPTQQIAGIKLNPETGTRQLSMFRWGLIPPWAGFPPIGYRMINARAETVFARRAFSQAFQKKRCLVLADGFYEWKKPGIKKPYYVRLRRDEPFVFAGIAEQWHRGDQTIESCAIITTKANKLMATIHNRMPVILSPDDYDLWIEPEFQDQDKLLSMLKPYPAEDMEAYPVGTFVNNPMNETEECIEAAD
jgi:putative SOS response-associated peptidase YedK